MTELELSNRILDTEQLVGKLLRQRKVFGAGSPKDLTIQETIDAEIYRQRKFLSDLKDQLIEVVA